MTQPEIETCVNNNRTDDQGEIALKNLKGSIGSSCNDELVIKQENLSERPLEKPDDIKSKTSGNYFQKEEGKGKKKKTAIQMRAIIRSD